MYLWVQFGQSPILVTDVFLPPSHVNGMSRAVLRRAWVTDANSGDTVVRDKSEATTFELRARTDGPTVITGIKIQPRAPDTQQHQSLIRDGWTCGSEDLGLVGLAKGMHIWIQRAAHGHGAPVMASVGVSSSSSLAPVPAAMLTVTDEQKNAASAGASPTAASTAAAALASGAGLLPLLQMHRDGATLQHVIDMLQLSTSQVKHLHSIFARIDTDHDGLVSIEEVLKSMQITPRPFFSYVASLACEPAELTFGDWCHLISIVGLFGHNELVRAVWSYFDKKHSLAMPQAQVLLLCEEMIATIPGIATHAAVARVLLDLPRSDAGTYTVFTFEQLCASCPVLIYPLAHLQDKIHSLVFGKD